MHSEIEIKDYPNGWFGMHQRCATGQDIYGWILEHAAEDQKKGSLICQKMIEKKFIMPVDESMGKAFNMNNLYRFHIDRDDIAANMIKKWKDPVNDPLRVSIDLVNLATDLYQ